MVVVDARHGIKVSDRQMIQFLSKYNVRFQIVLNKTDCLAPDDLARCERAAVCTAQGRCAPSASVLSLV